MARGKIPLTIITLAGDAVVSASVTINHRPGSAATIYQDETTGTTLSNPATTDSNGRVPGWLEAGTYSALISGGSPAVLSYTEHFDILQTDAEVIDDRVNSLLVAGTGITKTYDDTANTLTLDAAAGTGTYDDLGDDLTAYHAVTPGPQGHWLLSHGSIASPRVTETPALAVSLTQNITSATRATAGVSQTNADAQWHSAIVGVSRGNSTSLAMAVGMSAAGHSYSTTATGEADGCGLWALGGHHGIGGGFGAYIEGRIGSAATSGIPGVGARCRGVEVRTANYEATASSSAYVPTPYSNNVMNALQMSNVVYNDAGTAAGGDGMLGGTGILFYRPIPSVGTNRYGQFDVGIACTADGIPIANAFIRDDGASERSIYINGTHATAAIEIADGAGPLTLGDNYLNLGATPTGVWGFDGYIGVDGSGYAGSAGVAIFSTASESATVDFWDYNDLKFQVGKHADNSFMMWDYANVVPFFQYDPATETALLDRPGGVGVTGPLRLAEQGSPPATPATATAYLYAEASGATTDLKVKDDAGVVATLLTSAGGAGTGLFDRIGVGTSVAAVTQVSVKAVASQTAAVVDVLPESGTLPLLRTLPTGETLLGTDRHQGSGVFTGRNHQIVIGPHTNDGGYCDTMWVPWTSVTVANANDEYTTASAHGLSVNEPVQFRATTMPTGLTAGATYYVIATGLTTTAFRVSATGGGSAVNITSDGTAVQVGSPRQGQRERMTVHTGWPGSSFQYWRNGKNTSDSTDHHGVNTPGFAAANATYWTASWNGTHTSAQRGLITAYQTTMIGMRPRLRIVSSSYDAGSGDTEFTLDDGGGIDTVDSSQVAQPQFAFPTGSMIRLHNLPSPNAAVGQYTLTAGGNALTAEGKEYAVVSSTLAGGILKVKVHVTTSGSVTSGTMAMPMDPTGTSYNYNEMLIFGGGVNIRNRGSMMRPVEFGVTVLTGDAARASEGTGNFNANIPGTDVYGPDGGPAHSHALGFFTHQEDNDYADYEAGAVAGWLPATTTLRTTAGMGITFYAAGSRRTGTCIQIATGLGPNTIEDGAVSPFVESGWVRALVLEDSLANEIFTIDGFGRLGFNVKRDANNNLAGLPARITFGDGSSSVYGIQFGTTAPVYMYQSASNTLRITNAATAFRGYSGMSVGTLHVQDVATGTSRFIVKDDGEAQHYDASGVAQIVVGSGTNGKIIWSPWGATLERDTSSSGWLKWTSASFHINSKLFFSANGSIGIVEPGGSGHIEMVEQTTDPGTPGTADRLRLFSKDVGGSDTALYFKDGSTSVFRLATVKSPGSPIWGVPVSNLTGASSVTPAADDMYITELPVGAPCTLTGMQVVIGVVPASGNVLVSLYDSTGTLLISTASTALAGTTTNTLKSIVWALGATAKLRALGTYYVGVQFDSTAVAGGVTFKGFGAGNPGITVSTALDTSPTSFTPPATITPPTTFTSGVGPIVRSY